MNPKLVVIAFAFVVLISVAYTLHLTNEIAIQGEQIILLNNSYNKEVQIYELEKRLHNETQQMLNSTISSNYLLQSRQQELEKKCAEKEKIISSQDNQIKQLQEQQSSRLPGGC